MQSGDKDDDLATIEEQYLQAIEAEPDHERLYIHERDTYMRNIWGSFQESATSIAQLYRGELWFLCALQNPRLSDFGRSDCHQMKEPRTRPLLLCQTFWFDLIFTDIGWLSFNGITFQQFNSI